MEVADKTSQDIVNTCLSPGSLLSVATTNIEQLEGDQLRFDQLAVFKGDVTVDSSFANELQACVCQTVENGSATETLQANAVEVEGECEELEDALVEDLIIEGTGCGPSVSPTPALSDDPDVGASSKPTVSPTPALSEESTFTNSPVDSTAPSVTPVATSKSNKSSKLEKGTKAIKSVKSVSAGSGSKSFKSSNLDSKAGKSLSAITGGVSKTSKSQEQEASSKMSSKSMKVDPPDVAATMSKEEDSPAHDEIIEKETNTAEEVAGTEEEASDDKKSSFASWVFETVGDLLNGLVR